MGSIKFDILHHKCENYFESELSENIANVYENNQIYKIGKIFHLYEYKSEIKKIEDTATAIRVLNNTYCVHEHFLYKLCEKKVGWVVKNGWHSSFNGIAIKTLKKSCYNSSKHDLMENFIEHFKHFTVTTTNIETFKNLTPEKCDCGCMQNVRIIKKVQYCEDCYHNLIDCSRGIILKEYFIEKNFSY